MLYWGCSRTGCTGYAAADDQGRPLGVPAGQEDREWRKRAHRLLRETCERLGWDKATAYRYLRTKLNLSAEDCHLGRMFQPECEAVMSALAEAGNHVPKTSGRPPNPLTAALRGQLETQPDMSFGDAMRWAVNNGFNGVTEGQMRGAFSGAKRYGKPNQPKKSGGGGSLQYVLELKKLLTGFGGVQKAREFLDVVEAAGGTAKVREALDFLNELSK